MRLESFLQEPAVFHKYKKIKPFFALKESLYEVTNQCQLRCEGCYYFTGDKHQVDAQNSVVAWSQLFEAEAKRGITFANIAGAEPSLVPEILEAANKYIPRGVVYTNGLKKIPEHIRYKLHLSIWGNEETDMLYRGVNCLDRQLKNYTGDDRAVFVYTFNNNNIDDVHSLVQKVVNADCKIAFNFFSDVVGGAPDMKLSPESLSKLNKTLKAYVGTSPNILLTDYFVDVHTSEEGLYKQFGCPYPKMTTKPNFGVAETFKNYRADLSVAESTCCSPDVECYDCRNYAAGSVIVSAAFQKHMSSEQSLRQWLDYIDNYLAVFMADYTMGEPLAYA